jgi:uncharacterized membrane protein
LIRAKTRSCWSDASGIHFTEHRTGVLIFASVAERYAEIVADSGINAKVQPDVWPRAIAAMIPRSRTGVRAMVSWLPSSCAASSWPCTSHPVR